MNRLATMPRKTYRPTFGADDVRPSWLPEMTPCTVQGLSRRRCTMSHQTVTPSKRPIARPVIMGAYSRLTDARLAWLGRVILRNEILIRARHAVVIRPAVDDGELRPPIPVHGGRIRRLPLERRRAPRIRVGCLAFQQAVDDVDEEDELRRRDEDRGDRDSCVDVVRGLRDEVGLAVRIGTARHAQNPEIVQ